MAVPFKLRPSKNDDRIWQILFVFGRYENLWILEGKTRNGIFFGISFFSKNRVECGNNIQGTKQLNYFEAYSEIILRNKDLHHHVYLLKVIIQVQTGLEYSAC